MQIGFLNESSRSIVPSVLRLLDECKHRKLPVVFTRFINRPSSAFESLLSWTKVSERPEIDLHNSFISPEHLVIENNYYSAFTDYFERLFKEQEYETLLISGVSTESCVLKTALDAFEREVRPIVVSDACASDQGFDVHLQALELMTIMIGQAQLKTIDEVVRELDSTNRIGDNPSIESGKSK